MARDSEFLFTEGSSTHTLMIPHSELETIKSQMRSNRVEGVETGGVLLGRYLPDNRAVVVDATEPGPNAEHYSAEFAPDVDHAQTRLDNLREEWDIFWIGTWHKHPGHMNSPSGGDVRQMREFISDPETLDSITAIITTEEKGDVRVNGFHLDSDTDLKRIQIEAVDFENPIIQSLRHDSQQSPAEDTGDEAPSTTTEDTSTKVDTTVDSTDLGTKSRTQTDFSNTVRDRHWTQRLTDHPLIPSFDSFPFSTRTDRSSRTVSTEGTRVGRTKSTRKDDRAQKDTQEPRSNDVDTAALGGEQTELEQAYVDLKARDDVSSVDIRRGEDFHFVEVAIKSSETPPIVFVCSDKFPEESPTVVYKDGEGLEEFEKDYTHDWTSTMQLDRLLSRILDQNPRFGTEN